MAKTKSNPLMAKALSYQRKNGIQVRQEEIEIAVAWLRGEINLSQASAAYAPEGRKGHSGNSLYRIAVCLREAHKLGQLQVTA